jgi:transcriptional regulator with XRE-family HTH domain
MTDANGAATLRHISPQFRGAGTEIVLGAKATAAKAPVTASIKSIGARLQDARRAARLSQQQVGRLFHPPITRSAVAQWETDAALPDLNRLATIAFAYGVSIDWIVTGRAAPEHARPPELREHLSPDAIQVAVAWSLLAQHWREVWRASLFRNVALERAMPWLPHDDLESFADFEAKFRQEIEEHGVRPSKAPGAPKGPGNGHRRKT